MKFRTASLLIVAFIILSVSLNAQVVVTDPPLPIVTQPVTVVFDATLGSGGLAGYTGDIYAHTGVITEFSNGGSDWKYVKTNWGQNTPDTKLTRISQDRYSLSITPNIRDYYGVPVDEQILKMAFVFRSATQVEGVWLEGKTETGGDIFVDVYEAGLNVAFIQPQQFPIILELNDSFITEVSANEADSILLYLNDLPINKAAGNYILDTLTADDYGKYEVKAIAKNSTGMVADSFYYHVRSTVTVESLPAGVRDGINYVDNSTATLVLLAPKKNFIYVMGDFNDWEVNDNYYMKMTPDSLRYWLTINGLVPGKEYVFQYFVDGTIKIGDPYADKVSDPWNDSYIDTETYPDLIQYPQGKTTGVATVLQTAQQPYQWEVESFTPPAITDLVIYELLVRDFTEKHSYQAVADTLDYLARLGVNAVELMPANEFEGNISWGYNPSFYFAPDKYYGPKNSLKKLVDECHKRGIAVVMDLVLNHAYDQCPLVQMYFDGVNPTPDNPWFNVHSNFTNPDAQWGNDFNQLSPYTQQLVDSINSYWMTEYNIDGFRFDFTKGFCNCIKGSNDPWGSNYDADRIANLKRMADQIWVRNPDAFVIFEHLAENAEEKELANYGILLWGNMSGSYGEAAMGWHDSNKSNFSWISYKNRGWNDPHVVGYMESHDEERLVYKCLQWGNASGNYSIKNLTTALNRMELDAVFFLTVPGPKMIWQFGEMGYDYSIEYNGRTGPKPVRWDYLQDENRKYLVNLYGAVNKLKTENPAFETGTFTLTVNAALKKINLMSPEMNIAIIGNFDVVQGQIVPGFQHSGAWFEYFTGDTLNVASISDPVVLQAGEYRLYTDVKLEAPSLGLGPELMGNDVSTVSIFPNPSRQFNIILDLKSSSEVRISLFDITGKLVTVIQDSRLAKGTHNFTFDSLDQNQLQPGIYIMEIRADQFREARKIVIQ